jgi:3-hydroxybutyrate dehydrogenase
MAREVTRALPSSTMATTCGLDLTGRTALVTGGASGIGRACAHRLADAGAHVLVLDRDRDPAGEVADAVGGRAVVADLSDPSVVDRLGLDADILVNNAGLQHVAPVEEFDPERFSLILRVMLEAPFRLARVLLPGMYERGWGRVVNISSVHGHRASAYKSAYVSAKHGLEGLSKTIALEAAGRGVTSNTVCPGYVRTPLVEGQIADQARAHGGQAPGRAGRGRRLRGLPVRTRHRLGHRSLADPRRRLDRRLTAHERNP